MWWGGGGGEAVAVGGVGGGIGKGVCALGRQNLGMARISDVWHARNLSEYSKETPPRGHQWIVEGGHGVHVAEGALGAGEGGGR